MVGLGHRLLCTTPESLHERLPLESSTGAHVITADVRLDNRDELIHQLDMRGGTGRVITDSELMLAAYRRWGETCPEKLLGDFAFAIRDEREQRLFCARDHLGIKPFLNGRTRSCLATS